MQNALLLHNQHWQNISFKISIKRNLLNKLIDMQHIKEIQIITGLRRSGKSSLLKLYINELIKHTNPKSILFVNFDDPNFSEIYNKPEKIYKIIETAERITKTKIEYLFLDEIQTVIGWEKYIKSVYDAEKFKKICITGSNSELLQSNYSTLLSGRYIINQLFPLSITEILNHYGFTDKITILKNKSKILNIIEKSIKYGTFPEVLLKEKEQIRHEILTNYYDSILLKDCVINKNIRDYKSFKELAFYIFNNIGTPFSFNSLSKATEINDGSIKEYINAMQEAFLLYEISQFSFKIKTKLKSKRKLYTIDNGLITAISLNFSENKGRMFENFVFAELLKNGFNNISFFNDSKECDFIIKKGKQLTAIQVTYDLNNSNREREINGLINVRKKLKIEKLFIITFSQSETINELISVIPVYELEELFEKYNKSLY